MAYPGWLLIRYNVNHAEKQNMGSGTARSEYENTMGSHKVEQHPISKPGCNLQTMGHDWWNQMASILFAALQRSIPRAKQATGPTK